MIRPRSARTRTPVRRGAGRTASALALLLACGGCGSDGPPPPPPVATVFAARPLVRPVVEWDDYTARLRAVDTVEIRPRVGGYLQALHFSDGQAVKQGDRLFTIDPRPLEAAVTSAEGNLAAARARLQEAQAARTQAFAADIQAEAALELRDTQLARSKKLVDRGAETQENYDIEASQRKQAAADVAAARAAIKSADAAIKTAEANIATAEAALATAELDLSFTEVRSPIDGRASRHLVDVGNLVVGEGGGAATLLTTVVSLDPIHAFVSAPERAFLKYVRQANRGDRPSSRTVRNPAVMQLADEDGYPHVGAIDFVDNQLDAGTDTMTGRLVFPNPDGVLTPGLFAKVQILGSGLYEALLIPDAAVTVRMNAPTVLVVVPFEPPTGGEDGAAGPPAAPIPEGAMSVEQRTVELGPLLAGLRVVKSGLSADERVVVRGLQAVRPGSPVLVEDGAIDLDEAAFAAAVRLDLARSTLAPRPAADGADAADPAPAAGDTAEPVAAGAAG